MHTSLKLVSILVLMGTVLSATAVAGDLFEKYKGKCVDSYPLEYYVVAKHSGRLIELNSPTFGRALVKTKKQNFKIGPLNISFKYKAKKKMPLDNGFDADFSFWEECR